MSIPIHTIRAPYTPLLPDLLSPIRSAPPHILARIGEDRVYTLDGRAAIGVGIGYKGRWVVPRRQAPPAVGHGDDRAVLVHLAVAFMVEPAPGEDRLARGCVRGQLEIDLVPVGRTSAHDGQDHLPRPAIVVREGDLAGTALVRCTVRTERHGLP